jgi:hypothetical protein
MDEIIADARKNISVHYLHNIVHAAGKTASKGGTWCQIIDTNDYSQYFYEPKKFIMLEERTIRSLDQRSAHQNAIIAFKKWEEEIRSFLANPERNYEVSDRDLKMAIGHPTPPAQVRAVLKISSRLQKSPPERVRQNGVSRSRQK